MSSGPEKAAGIQGIKADSSPFPFYFVQTFSNQTPASRVTPIERSYGKATGMKIRLRNALTSNVNPVFFALTCLLLVTVMLSAKLMADQVGQVADAGVYRFAIINRYFWLEPD